MFSQGLNWYVSTPSATRQRWLSLFHYRVLTWFRRSALDIALMNSVRILRWPLRDTAIREAVTVERDKLWTRCRSFARSMTRNCSNRLILNLSTWITANISASSRTARWSGSSIGFNAHGHIIGPTLNVVPLSWREVCCSNFLSDRARGRGEGCPVKGLWCRRGEVEVRIGKAHHPACREISCFARPTM